MTSLILGWIGDQFITNLLLKITVVPANIRDVISPICGVLIFTFFHAVFTDLVPKNMAIDKPVPILMAIVHPIQFFHTIFYPFVWLFAVVAAWVTKLLGYNVQPEEDTYSQNEIMTLSQQSEKAGEMDKEDVIFMQRAFEMNDKVAEDIMIDRTQLAVIDITASIADAAQLYFEKKFTDSRLSLITIRIIFLVISLPMILCGKTKLILNNQFGRSCERFQSFMKTNQLLRFSKK